METGTANADYNLISTLYHLLQEAETCERYIQDAAGDEALIAFFRDCQQSATALSQKAKELLKDRLAHWETERQVGERRADEASKQSFPASDAPAY